MATDTKGEGASQRLLKVIHSLETPEDIYLSTLGITLGCVAVSSLEAGPLVLVRVGSETGAATFLDLGKYRSTSISLVSQARAISPAPISPPPNFQRGREIGSAMLSIGIYLEIHLPH